MILGGKDFKKLILDKFEKKPGSKGWILEESWRKFMDDVNSWRAWWVSMVLGCFLRNEEKERVLNT